MHGFSFLDCQGCLRDFKETLSYFPVRKGDRCAERKAVLKGKQWFLNKKVQAVPKYRCMIRKPL